MKELPTGSALLSTGSQDRPDTCVPLSAHQGAAALCNPSVNNRLAKGLLSSIVSWGHSTAFGTDKTVQTVFSNTDRFINKLNGLLNFGFFDWLTTACIAAVTTISVKRDRLVNLILPEWLSIDPFMAQLAALATGTIGLFGFRRLDNIRG